MPAGEFKQHYLFWHRFKWGIQDDILSVIATQQLAMRTRSKPMEPYMLKDAAPNMCSQRVFRITSAKSILSSVKGFLKGLGHG